MKPRQILYCPKCEFLIKNPIHSFVQRPCCTEYGRMTSYVIEKDHVLKSSHEELLEAAKRILKTEDFDIETQHPDCKCSFCCLFKAIAKAELTSELKEE